MTQEFRYKQALKQALQMENELIGFYRRAEQCVTDPAARRVFEHLLTSEREQVAEFSRRYQGRHRQDMTDFGDKSDETMTVMMYRLEKLIDKNIDERHAMEIVLREEESYEKSLRFAASQVIDPISRLLFEQMAFATHAQYQVLESEYAHLMGMVHETDMDTYVRE